MPLIEQHRTEVGVTNLTRADASKSHLTYAQGTSAELVAMLTIGAADVYGLPVSTTMAANRSGLQMATIRNLIMAGC